MKLTPEEIHEILEDQRAAKCVRCDTRQNLMPGGLFPLCWSCDILIAVTQAGVQ